MPDDTLSDKYTPSYATTDDNRKGSKAPGASVASLALEAELDAVAKDTAAPRKKKVPKVPEGTLNMRKKPDGLLGKVRSLFSR